MKTAIDSSVLLSILKYESESGLWQRCLEELNEVSQLVICEVTFAEIAAHFRHADEALEKLELLYIRYDRLEPKAAYEAGRAFQEYRKKGGPRSHLVPDFLIAAHALCQCEGLVAADRGYYRSYFRKLKVHSI